MQRNCDKCTRPFEVPPSALNKRFCSAGCRDAWHSEERKAVAEELRRRRTDAANAALGELLAPDTSKA
jgi:hypothetical protein